MDAIKTRMRVPQATRMRMPNLATQRCMRAGQRECVCWKTSNANAYAREKGNANAYASRRRRKASQEVIANAQDGINGGVGRVAESAYTVPLRKGKGLKRGDEYVR